MADVGAQGLEEGLGVGDPLLRLQLWFGERMEVTGQTLDLLE
ncbi:hypothetical protein [Phenylobacterium zucineum]|nr:hypothetical protein [Phenylobacterium zucineum]